MSMRRQNRPRDPSIWINASRKESPVHPASILWKFDTTMIVRYSAEAKGGSYVTAKI
jgi:hypothetical protein